MAAVLEEQEVAELLEEHSLLTFRYLSQHAHLPVARAKELLQSYADAHRADGVHLVYLVGGVCRGDAPSGCVWRLRPPFRPCLARLAVRVRIGATCFSRKTLTGHVCSPQVNAVQAGARGGRL